MLLLFEIFSVLAYREANSKLIDCKTKLDGKGCEILQRILALNRIIRKELFRDLLFHLNSTQTLKINMITIIHPIIDITLKIGSVIQQKSNIFT